jgi:hypothetical protein
MEDSWLWRSGRGGVVLIYWPDFAILHILQYPFPCLWVPINWIRAQQTMWLEKSKLKLMKTCSDANVNWFNVPSIPINGAFYMCHIQTSANTAGLKQNVSQQANGSGRRESERFSRGSVIKWFALVLEVAKAGWVGSGLAALIWGGNWGGRFLKAAIKAQPWWWLDNEVWTGQHFPRGFPRKVLWSKKSKREGTIQSPSRMNWPYLIHTEL